mmetsp:Transcript_78498/g.188235  ORF Transcript_78498/g.188235 Transcript_78498/m.188235 type:complete len:274 (-) Transcript_78498:596-1417(-)
MHLLQLAAWGEQLATGAVNGLLLGVAAGLQRTCAGAHLGGVHARLHADIIAHQVLGRSQLAAILLPKLWAGLHHAGTVRINCLLRFQVRMRAQLSTEAPVANLPQHGSLGRHGTAHGLRDLVAAQGGQTRGGGRPSRLRGGRREGSGRCEDGGGQLRGGGGAAGLPPHSATPFVDHHLAGVCFSKHWAAAPAPVAAVIVANLRRRHGAAGLPRHRGAGLHHLAACCVDLRLRVELGAHSWSAAPALVPGALADLPGLHVAAVPFRHGGARLHH